VVEREAAVVDAVEAALDAVVLALDAGSMPSSRIGTKKQCTP
jgi:hypothetical protein